MKKKIIYIGILAVIGLLFLPFVLWQVDSGEELQVLIMDKTVPDQTYREHKGITWGLNHYKYLKADNSEYDLTQDYVGFHPQAENNYEITSITNENENLYDLIYMADTYGVYEDEFYGENQEGNRSELIYGGLTIEDLTAIESEIYINRTPLIAEFNSFASPTDQIVRNRFTSLLGLKWEGWMARYFDELDPALNDELPTWMIENYQRQTEEEWSFTDAGLIFVRDDDFIVVLEEAEDFGGEGILFDFTETGQAFFDTTLSSRYDYWFDIVEPTEAEVLANYTLGLTQKGQDRMREYGISDTIPAVTRTLQSGTPLYYFTGDYADLETTPSFYQYKGLDWLYRTVSQLQRKGSQSFYYRAYLPMMKMILQDTYTNKQTVNSVERSNIDMYRDKDVAYHSRVNETHFEIYRDGSWEEFEIQGVNMGMAKPGAWPGESAITFEEYARWIEQIDEMGANVIRVYTVHPPEFYQALWLHNQQSKSPIYVMHGVWIEEEALEETLNAYLPATIDAFEREIEDVIDVVHGNVTIEPKIGHASGKYAYDISQYVLGYILGIEWYPLMVEETNKLHESTDEFEGDHFSTKGANAFEKWLAARMEFITAYEANNYETMHPISFTNWPTTDLLDHPSEPSAEEDMVSVDPNNIYESNELKTGYFASYHVYPYYPDFFNYEEDYLNFIDHRGQKNSYAGYLKDLIDAHRMPLIVAEFGVPSSRGMTHVNPFGWNQGFLSEEEQGDIVVRLFEDIYEQGAVGGIMFTWQDEWFKRTWNTMELDNPDQRPYWSNMQTNEQRFGLLSFETHKKLLDGDKEKWQEDELLMQKEDGLLRGISVDHDEAYLYLMIDYDPKEWNSEMSLNVLLNTIDGQGNKSVPFVENQTFEQGIDFVIEISDEEQSRVWVDSYYDPFYYQYGYELEFLEDNQIIENNDGQFNQINLALSKPMVIPSTGLKVPFDYYETGLLKEGIGSPESDSYDSLADYTNNKDSGMVEMRIPWLLLNVKDPSHKEILGDLWSEGLAASTNFETIDISISATENKRLIDQLPNDKLADKQMLPYSFEKSEQPEYKERLKESYTIIKDYLNN
ncbi:hypothetical protein [Alkalibacterium sp. 20]|uniref:hypothetical protein n=1 Tax=Alkalibacterium sp. 20 TaxID=1798803 RepID=UPI0008FFF3E3|nr:hypothetical protein [Alkalibacterium sp. 20]OJF92550.1 hypothetical protein AX762_10005 [Alkalibacterium sp. 20]